MDGGARSLATHKSGIEAPTHRSSQLSGSAVLSTALEDTPKQRQLYQGPNYAVDWYSIVYTPAPGGHSTIVDSISLTIINPADTEYFIKSHINHFA
ncbi:hypothetical protein LB506_007498 [Fusarium annulatum]|nr:hypothetical protein LB506_007498 [Fusarium annulatum]